MFEMAGESAYRWNVRRSGGINRGESAGKCQACSAFFLAKGSSGKVLTSGLQCGWHIRGTEVEVGRSSNGWPCIGHRWPFSGPGSWTQGGASGHVRSGILRREVGFGGGVGRGLKNGGGEGGSSGSSLIIPILHSKADEEYCFSSVQDPRSLFTPLAVS